MDGLIILFIIGSIFAALGLSAMRWGVDTREWSFGIR